MALASPPSPAGSAEWFLPHSNDLLVSTMLRNHAGRREVRRVPLPLGSPLFELCLKLCRSPDICRSSRMLPSGHLEDSPWAYSMLAPVLPSHEGGFQDDPVLSHEPDVHVRVPHSHAQGSRAQKSRESIPDTSRIDSSLSLVMWPVTYTTVTTFKGLDCCTYQTAPRSSHKGKNSGPRPCSTCSGVRRTLGIRSCW